MSRGRPFSHVTVVLFGAAAAFAAVLAISAAASAANLPPRESCGALTVAQETANLNTTTGAQGRWISVNVTLCDYEEPQQNLTYTVESDPASGWSTNLNATGNIQIRAVFPGNSMVGFNWFNVTICDSQQACIVESFHVWIDNANDPPVISTMCATWSVAQGERFQLDVDVVDPDDAIRDWVPTTFTFSDDVTLFDITPSGRIDFTATNYDVGAWNFQIVVRDNGNPQLSDTLSCTITVTNVNDPPVLPPYSDFSVTQGVTFTAPLIGAADPDLYLFAKLPAGEQESIVYSDDCAFFNIVRVDSVNQQTGALEPAGKIQITATNDQVGNWTCTITVTDRAGLSDTLVIHIVVNNQNDPPSILGVNVTDQDTGETRTVTVDNGKVSFPEGDWLRIQVQTEDADLHMRVSEPTVKVDPAEALTCSILVTFQPGGDTAPSGTTEKPTIDAQTCGSEFLPGNNEVGEFSITFTVRDNQQVSVNFRIKLQILNKNQPPTNVRILLPVSDFLWPSDTDISLQGAATDPDTPDSLLTFAWKVQIEGGRTYTASGKTATIHVTNGAIAQATVTVTMTVTDNLEAASPITAVQVIFGNIQGSTTVQSMMLRVQHEGEHAFPGTVFTLSVYLAGGGSLSSVTWEFGDGSEGTGTTVEHAYVAAGTYNATVRATDSGGANFLAHAIILVVPLEPAKIDDVNVTGVPTATGAGVDFAVNVTGAVAPVTVNWSFGDGTNGTGTQAQHTYAAAGDYNVTVSVKDASGRETKKTFEVTADRMPLPPPEPVVAGGGWNPLALLVIAGAVAGLAVWRIKGRRGEAP